MKKNTIIVMVFICFTLCLTGCGRVIRFLNVPLGAKYDTAITKIEAYLKEHNYILERTEEIEENRDYGGYKEYNVEYDYDTSQDLPWIHLRLVFVGTGDEPKEDSLLYCASFMIFFEEEEQVTNCYNEYLTEFINQYGEPNKKTDTSSSWIELSNNPFKTPYYELRKGGSSVSFHCSSKEVFDKKVK